MIDKFKNSLWLINGECISYVANVEWDNEDISAIISVFIQQYSELELKETHLGADRQSCNLIWRSVPLWLHFENCSQSIWLEAVESLSKDKMPSLFRYLTE